MLDDICCVAEDDDDDDDDDDGDDDDGDDEGGGGGDKKDAIQCLHIHTPTARALAPQRPGNRWLHCSADDGGGGDVDDGHDDVTTAHKHVLALSKSGRHACEKEGSSMAETNRETVLALILKQ